jgi:hypothetical protein
MRIFACPECDHVHAIGPDASEFTAASHALPDGTQHVGARAIEDPGHAHDDADVRDWFVAHPFAKSADLLAAFPPVAPSAPAEPLPPIDVVEGAAALAPAGDDAERERLRREAQRALPRLGDDPVAQRAWLDELKRSLPPA